MNKRNFVIPLHFKCTQEEFDNKQTKDNIKIQCAVCQQIFARLKKNILKNYTHRKSFNEFCSDACKGAQRTKDAHISVECLNCKSIFLKSKGQLRKTQNSFCSSSCTFNNKNKTHGTRRSKIEIYLEQQLTLLFSNLEIQYSNKQIIGSELDLYIPSLKLAFEIQGIFHYKPIYGQEKLKQIQKK